MDAQSQTGEGPSANGQSQPAGKGVPTRARLLGIFIGALLGMCLLGAIQFPGSPEARIGFSLLLFLLIPVQSGLGYYHLKRGRPLAHKHLRYVVAVLAQGMLLTLGLRIGYSLAPEWFHPRLGHPVAIFVAGMLAGVPMLNAYQRWKRAGGTQEVPRHSLLPATTGELAFWIPVALLAGMAEEIAYRGVAVALVHRWTGSAALAVGASAVAFGLAHVTQGGKTAVMTALFGLGLQLVFSLTATLYLPILVHALYDLLLGIMFVFLNRRAGQAPVPQPSG